MPGRWNRQDLADRQAWDSALGWSITAMRETTGQLAVASAADVRQGLSLVNDAVWCLTIVDAALVRYQPRRYEGVLAARGPSARRLIEATFAGLRFVRNRMGFHDDPADFVDPAEGASSSDAAITTWTWKHRPEPVLDALPKRRMAWEMARYQAYQDRLAGYPVGEALAGAAGFLAEAAAGMSLAEAASA